MRILIVNELYECGGAENVFRDEVRLCLGMGHEVCAITFDPNFNSPVVQYHLNYPYDGGKVWKFAVRTLGDHRLACKLFDDIKAFKPHCIHVHNAVNCMLSLAKAICAYRLEHPEVKTIQTLHDYGVVCPKSWCVHDDGTLCRGYSKDRCIGNKCKLNFQDALKRLTLSKTNSIRRKTFQRLVSPSLFLANTCIDNGLKVECVRNPFEAPLASMLSFAERENSFIYTGAIAERKGCTNLMLAWKASDLANAGWKLRLIGGVEADYQATFSELIEGAYGVEYVGRLSRGQTLGEVSKAKFLVAPSLWLENYPTTVLEAMGCGTVSLGSTRGGVAELIGNNGILFNPLSIDSISEAMKTASSIDGCVWDAWSVAGARRVVRENDPCRYIESLYGKEAN